MKPGYLSTEFALTAAMQVIAILVAFGVIAAGDRTTIEGAISEAIKAVGALAVAGATLWKYIQSRLEQKVAAMETETALAVSRTETKAQVETAKVEAQP